MPDTLFQGIFDTQLTAVIAPEQFLLCVGASLVIGLVLCAMMLWRTRPSTGFAVTLATLPAVVCVVIMMVNGNVGAGVAVAGEETFIPICLPFKNKPHIIFIIFYHKTKKNSIPTAAS